MYNTVGCLYVIKKGPNMVIDGLEESHDEVITTN